MPHSSMRSLLTLAAALVSVSAPSAAEEPRSPETAAPWVLGIARFSARDLPLELLPLADAIPRLIAAELVVLPDRLQSEAELREARELAAERARFQRGAELAARLDERAARFLDPSLAPQARGSELAAADKKVAEAALRLEPDQVEAEPARPGEGEAPGEKPSLPRTAALWEGHGRGELVDEPQAAWAAAAKAKGLDLLVHGSVSPEAGYALVRVEGYDAALDRTVFSWKGFCSPEDPEPLAADFAARLERWTAGRDLARLDIAVEPRAAIVLADGKRLTTGKLSIYRYEPSTVRVEAAAAGYTTAAAEVALAPGERRSVSLALEPRVLGAAAIEVDPPHAKLLVDSLPLAGPAEGAGGGAAGPSPLSVPLSGKREIVAAFAPGRESAIVVLPPSGEAKLRIELKPDDGLGAGGRVLAAKDEFYKAFGWFFVSLPISSLAAGTVAIYGEAAQRSLDDGLISSYYATELAAGAAIAASVGLAINMFVRLARYLRVAR